MMKKRCCLLIFVYFLVGGPVVSGAESELSETERTSPTTLPEEGCYQFAPVPYHIEDIRMDSRTDVNLNSDGTDVFSQVIRIPGAAWLRLNFCDTDLGRQAHLSITSALDGGSQILDDRSLVHWENSSAIFNGNEVRIELHGSSVDEGIFFTIDRLVVGDPQDGIDTKSLCGTDNRVASTDSRVGRLFFGGCTSWMISNGRFLTAGHCVDFDPDQGGPSLPDGILDLSGVVEFNVPASQSNGTTVAADPSDQYPINTSSVVWRFDGEGQGLGKDWAVFTVNPNSNTGLTPFQAQGGFFRTTNGNPAVSNTMRVTGMGLDNTPVGSTGNRNAQNFTNQTSTGGYVDESVSGSNIWHRYAVDTTGGSSGSPVMWGSFTVGIHTNAGCAANGTGANSGTSFEVNALETAIDNHPGSSTIYADKTRWGATENGTIFHPHDTFNEAVATVPTNGKVSMVTGTYSDTGLYTKQMFVVAPVGSVLIGQ
jgi:trimeric autotransporter adhesin